MLSDYEWLVTYVVSDIAAMDACETVHMCVPVLDTLLANMHYGVLSFSQPDLKEICLLVISCNFSKLL